MSLVQSRRGSRALSFSFPPLWIFLASWLVLTSNAERVQVSLGGSWLFQTNGASSWKTVQLPADWESHEDTGFDGVGWYRREITGLKTRPGTRVLLHFDAAATAAEVFWNGSRLGTHLGGWTPFRFDVTDLVREGSANEIKIRLDEKVGHNTQGFLPIVQPHFGGMWQSVRLEIVPTVFIDDLQVLAYGNLDTGLLEVGMPVRGGEASTVAEVQLKWRLRGSSEWTSVVLKAGQFAILEDRCLAKIPVGTPSPWMPESPALYEIEARILNTENQASDTIQCRAAFRKVEAQGTKLLLNGRPLNVRGVLNWGYYPPRLAPSPSEEQMKRDLEFVRDNGFNLLKFCLWIPPRRFLELADEMGVLTWMEYPTRHPQFTGKHLEELRTEFREFFYYDRNHPSIIVRSLTCETGPSADINVIKSLYDEAKRMIPGALVEDDSSWIAWNRVSDFYDDHPYGNNHTWVETLGGLNDYVAKHTPKPLLLGEAIAADTWPDWDKIETAAGNSRAHWVAKPLDSARQWITDMKPLIGSSAVESLRADSLHYGMLMRKYQVETFRREVPYGGYVVSVIRDISTASMGLLDYAGKPKWSAEQWSWQRDTMLLMKTPGDQRSSFGGETIPTELFVSHFGKSDLGPGRFNLALSTDSGTNLFWSTNLNVTDIQIGSLASLGKFEIETPSVQVPTRVLLLAELKVGDRELKNEWPLWLMPKKSTGTMLWAHSSLTPELRQGLFPNARPWDPADREGILVATKFDHILAQWLEKGGRVLLLPDGKLDSFPLRAHWFLRGAPYIGQSVETTGIPRELLLELQHFDISSRVIPEPPYVTEIEPLLMLWDTHDRTNVVSHALTFQTGVGKGKLLVSALRHEHSAAGQWLLTTLLEQLGNAATPGRSLREETWSRLKQQINAQELRLADLPWDFQPGTGESTRQDELESERPISHWKTIRLGRHWEAQGYAALDGWASYRLKVRVPAEWRDRPIFLTFTGVDDVYELHLNGKLFSRRGDIATRQSTFAETFSHDVTRIATPGEELEIVVRVYDWFGAGGIFQPVFLGTARHEPGQKILSREN